jgi:hypothetical protein
MSLHYPDCIRRFITFDTAINGGLAAFTPSSGAAA